MQKPKNYETTRGYDEYVPLDPGGYVCRVRSVTETKSQTGKDMVEIYLDIAEGDFKGYFAEQYRSDTRENKKWGSIVYQLTEDKDGFCNRGLRTFIDAVAASNAGFDPNAIWGDNFSKFFKDKLVGGVYRREQYANRNGDLRWSTKCFSFKSVDAIRAGVPVPEDKPLDAKRPLYNMPSSSDFSELSEDDGDLPF